VKLWVIEGGDMGLQALVELLLYCLLHEGQFKGQLQSE
jgi:hypothetical protein